MNDIKENRVNTLYKELCYYDKDLYKLSRILVKILPSEMIKRIINKLYRIRKEICIGENMYKEMPLDAMQPHDTWIIAFSPDTDSFFATDQRAYFWEYEKEFKSEESAINYFENHTKFFLKIDNEIMNKITGRTVDCVFFENTKKWYI